MELDSNKMNVSHSLRFYQDKKEIFFEDKISGDKKLIKQEKIRKSPLLIS